MAEPLDYPTPDRAHRLYVALTNHCNRACPWCSTCSSPAGSTWLSVAHYESLLPDSRPFQVQLEGGEPTIHPNFFELVKIARAHSRCTHVVLCTNGVVLPRTAGALRSWLRGLGSPLTVKLSVNHHLLASDPELPALASLLRNQMLELGGQRLLVVNARLRRGIADDDRAVREAIARAGLQSCANIFFLQRYGYAAGEHRWSAPSPVSANFTLINPDGRSYGTDLIARSEGMRALP